VRAAILFVAALGLAACSSSDVQPPASPDQQTRQTCEWFAHLINDVNSGKISEEVPGDDEAQGDSEVPGEVVRSRITHMYRLSIGSEEPIRPAVNRLIAWTRLRFEFDAVRPEIDGLRSACAQNDYRVPGLIGLEERLVGP
jgi:hypothetical protein